MCVSLHSFLFSFLSFLPISCKCIIYCVHFDGVMLPYIFSPRYVSIDFVRFQTHNGVAGPSEVSVGDDVLAPFPGDGANAYPFLYPAKARVY